MAEVRTMPYRQYKQHYADCEIVNGSYDERNKTIEVIIPEGREKPSGVRGQRFSGYELWAQDSAGKAFHICYRAVSRENAMKQHKRYCREEGWTPIEPPAGKIARIYR